MHDKIKLLFIENEACINFLLILFNYCFQYGVVPDAWFKTIIKPTPKSNPRSQSPLITGVSPCNPLLPKHSLN